MYSSILVDEQASQPTFLGGVRLGSWLCENAKTLNRDRRSYSSKTVLVAQRASGFNLEIELKNIILRRVSIFEFSHSQGQKRKCRRFQVMSALPHKADINARDCDVRFVPILLQKSFWGDERNFLEPLMRFTSGDVRDHIVSSKIDQGSP
jgi:hypothetical protein